MIVFKPDDFKLLRKPCNRYDTRAVRLERHGEGQVMSSTPLRHAQNGYSLGSGCYRVFPRPNGADRSNTWN